MQTESVLIQKEEYKSQWLRVSKLFEKTKAEHAAVIFIEDDFKIETVNTSLTCYTASGFVEARRILATLHEAVTNIIVINIPLQIAELERFSSFIKKETKAAIIYKKEHLTKHEVKFIKAFDLVDDAVDFDNSSLDKVITFTIEKRAKRKQKKLTFESKKFKTKGKEKAKDFSFFLKKIVDTFIAAVIILLLLPLFILIAIAIKIDSKGPVFYSAKRAGKGYKIFNFYKFRSMVIDADKKMNELAYLNQYNVADKGPVFFKLDNDPRVTRVGKFLRNTSLDELPQLFNILLGHMSLVGNRPLPLYEAATLTTNEFVERFAAPAGLTGFWQIKKRGRSEMSVKERVDLDIFYARKASPIFDLYIMANTPAALLQKSNV